MINKNQLIKISEEVQAKRTAARQFELSEQEKKLKQKISELIIKCDERMLSAANKGERYCEVEIPYDYYEKLKAHYHEFSPSINGDGYTITVICLRW